MKSKFTNARAVALSAALLTINAGPSLAANIVLNGGSSGNSCVYTALSANVNGDISVTCAGSNTPPTVAPVCNPTATVNPISAGTTTTLFANCSDAPTGTTYAWSTNPPSNFASSGSNVAVNPSIATTYSVQATNGFGPSVAKEVTVTISTASPPSPPPSPGQPLPMQEWVDRFMQLNNIPPSRWTLLGAYDYLKKLYLRTPSGYLLPPGGLLIGF